MMIFPAELRFNYVRVYQRNGNQNVGWDPAGYPTMEYTNNHIDAYTNPNLTAWGWPILTNSAYIGGLLLRVTRSAGEVGRSVSGEREGDDDFRTKRVRIREDKRS